MGESVAVTICVPLYKHADTVERCLRSALAQDHDDYEILVIDDASGDDGAAIAREMVRAGDRVVVNDPRLGMAGNHNRCIEMARGELIQFLHGDDELLPEALSTLTEAFAEGDDVALAFAPRHVVTEDEDFLSGCGTLHHRFRELNACNDADHLISEYVFTGLFSNWIGEPTCVMFRRDAALRVGGFRADLAQIVDLDLWLQLSAGHQIAFVNRELSVRHHGDATLSELNRRERRDWIDQPRVLFGVLGSPFMPARARLYAGLWLVNMYPRTMFDAVFVRHGSRVPRFRDAAALPAREIARSRRLRGQLVG